MSDGRESPSSAKVRELIFAYERHSNSTKPLEEYNGRPRAKSIGNALSYKLFRQPNLEIYSVMDIEKELVKIEAHLNYYEVYEKETHVAFQEQLFNILTSIVNIVPEDQEGAAQLKRKLIVETQKLATDLNSRLPFEGSHSYKGVRRTYSSIVRKEEAVVSTTSVKSHEHRAILSSSIQNSLSQTLNGGFKSEDSLNSTKDSIELPSRQDESADLAYFEERPSSTPPPENKIINETQPSLIPSVSKLKKFFSFRKEEKPEIKVTSASFSGLMRSQSLNTKTNKHTIIKKSKKEEARKQQEVIRESEEATEKKDETKSSLSASQQLVASERANSSQNRVGHEMINASQSVKSASTLQSSGSDVYIEPVKEIEDYVEIQNEASHNVSVSKLKSLFEKNQNETSEGNYMNFTGLIRNVDIEKKGDLSKSKSLSDLKITNFSYGTKDNDIVEDLSKEIDDDNDYEHVSINVKEESKEVNNNVMANVSEHSKEEVSTSVTSQAIQRESEPIFLSKSVETLKQAFENLSATSGQISKEYKEEDKYVLYKSSMEPVQSSSTVVVEPVLKVPIQLRPGVTTITNTEDEIGHSTTSTHTNESNDIKYIFHTKIKSISSSTDGSEGPKLEVPIQLKTGSLEAKSQEVSETIYEAKTVVVEDKKISEQHQSEPVPTIPIQLKVGEDSQRGLLKVTENFIHNEKVAHETSETVSSSESVEFLKQTNGNSTSTNNSELSDKEVNHILHETIEPILSFDDGSKGPVLKVPIGLRSSTSTVHNSTKEQLEPTKPTIENRETINEATETLSSAGIVETLIETYETIGSTNNSDIFNKEIKQILYRSSSGGTEVLEESHVLEVPIQLRTSAVGEEKAVDNNITNGYTSESLTSPGTVEVLTQTFENISSPVNSEANNEDRKYIINRTIEPILSSGSEESVLKVPIQLRTFAMVNDSHVDTGKEKTEDNVETIKDTTELYAVSGNVEMLTQTFENISSTVSDEANNEDIKHIIHRTIEPTLSQEDGTEEPVLKVPIQLRTFAMVNYSQDATELANSTVNTDSNNENIKHIIYRTIEPISSKDNSSEEPVLKVPIQLRTGFENVSHDVTETSEEMQKNTGSTNVSSETEVFLHKERSHSHKLMEQLEAIERADHISEHTSEMITQHGIVEAIKESFENLSTATSSEGTIVTTSEKTVLKIPIELRTEHLNEHTTEISQDDKTTTEDTPVQEPVLKIPIQLRVGNNMHTTETETNSGDIRISTSFEKHEKVPVVDVAYCSNIQGSPLNQSQQVSSSSASQVSMSYSEKKSLQHTISTHVSQRSVSTSSSSLTSQQSSQSYLQVLEEPVSYTLLRSMNPQYQNEESSVTITEVGGAVEAKQRLKVNLSDSQENIIDEILKETDLLENIDEEFEKVLEENSK